MSSLPYLSIYNRSANKVGIRILNESEIGIPNRNTERICYCITTCVQTEKSLTSPGQELDTTEILPIYYPISCILTSKFKSLHKPYPIYNTYYKSASICEPLSAVSLAYKALINYLLKIASSHTSDIEKLPTQILCISHLGLFNCSSK